MEKEKKYRIKKGKRFIEDDVDIENRKGYNIGNYAVMANGDVVFFESQYGGMCMFDIKNVKVQYATGLKDKNNKTIFVGDKVKGILRIPEHIAVDGKTEVHMTGIVEYNFDRYLLRTVEEESDQERYAIGATYGFIGDDGSVLEEMEIVK